MALGKIEEALEAFEKARQFAPENEEIRYWVGITLIGSNSNQSEGQEILKEIFAKNPNWVKVTKSLIEKGYLPKNSAVTQLL